MKTLKHLPYEHWPQADRDDWEAAFVERDVFDDKSSPGAHLSAGTRRMILFCYRRWLGHLAAEHAALLSKPPAARITMPAVRNYVAALQAENAATTVAISVDGLYRAAGLLAPQADWDWLRRVRTGLAARATPQDRFDRLIPPWLILDLGLQMMDRSLAAAEGPRQVRERRYRDGLLLALLALWPIRRRSLAALTVSRHVERAGKKYRLRLHPEDTKAGREESYDCPEILAPYIDHYLTEIRPLFPGADSNDGLWTSARGKPLCEGWLYELVGRHTKQAFGKAMCLHDFRRAAHTFLAMEAPELIGLIPGVLQHASPDVGDQHYNLARSTMASRRYAVHVSKVRERLRPAWRRQQQG